MAISFTPLASGSKGNSILVSNESHKFLIDCGLCFKELKNRLSMVDVKLEDIEAVFITHEHIDHIRATKLLSSRYCMPVYARHETMPKMFERVGCFEGKCFEGGETLIIGDIEINSFSTPHDAVAPVGYMMSDKNSRALYATDLGNVSEEILDLAYGSDLVMIESNYDKNMLENGAYPAFLKKRIGSEVGHLSNDKCADAILKIADKGTRRFILGHLSENNNTREKVRERLISVMSEAGATLGEDYFATIAWQYKVSERICSILK